MVKELKVIDMPTSESEQQSTNVEVTNVWRSWIRTADSWGSEFVVKNE